jgi:hypothetical protein
MLVYSPYKKDCPVSRGSNLYGFGLTALSSSSLFLPELAPWEK